ncbi:hypothetical protein A6F56_01205 [Prescottella equi]|uniref:hypothetical protein n=1 Tax=Rhodococcus hoagii TaxID=43767 RepID=UPI000A2288B9|nr:hypothetical protein [Prescottella equi]ORL00995.1 hypothetical protein A6F56_01205 [Prescottella equi]
MALKKIRVAVWEYHTDEGKRRRGYFGDTVDLTDAEIERGTAAGVFDQPEPESTAPQPEPVGDDPAPAPADPAADAPRRPRATATIEKWIAYAQAVGVNVDGLTDKDAVIAKVDAADD